MLFHLMTMRLGHHFLVCPLVVEMRESMHSQTLSQTTIQSSWGSQMSKWKSKTVSTSWLVLWYLWQNEMHPVECYSIRIQQETQSWHVCHDFRPSRHASSIWEIVKEMPALKLQAIPSKHKTIWWYGLKVINIGQNNSSSGWPIIGKPIG